MKNKKITSFTMFFLLIAMIGVVSAEVNFWSETYIDKSTQTVTKYGYYQFDDTSSKGVGKDKPIDLIILYDVEPLPYDLTSVGYAGSVDWCNLTINHDKNEYGGTLLSTLGLEAGDFIETETITTNYYFENSSNNFGQEEFALKDKDGITIEMKCHYTDLSSLFVESIYFGDFTTYVGAYQCDDCEEFSLEQLSNEVQRNEQIIEDQNEVYSKVQGVLDINFNIWLIFSWILKIGLIFTAITLIFGGIYWVYLLFKSIEDEI